MEEAAFGKEEPASPTFPNRDQSPSNSNNEASKKDNDFGDDDEVVPVWIEGVEEELNHQVIKDEKCSFDDLTKREEDSLRRSNPEDD